MLIQESNNSGWKFDQILAWESMKNEHAYVQGLSKSI